ncbi:MAG: class I SAM-dependent methyltransferase [Candidatus Obscuribacterales bacterium]|nr:class I SAM-dependent methyltransferase [Candidatus Obscuribacterales bacterium]
MMQPANGVGENIEQGLSGTPQAVPCFWCGDPGRRQIAIRNDRVRIMECRSCGHCAVEQVMIDLNEIYQNQDYFRKQKQPELDADNQDNVGYSNYEQISFADWNAEFFSALFLMDDLGSRSSSLSVLDIGCATGKFLDMAKAFGYKTLGIEPSLWAQEKCIEQGHQIVADSVEELNVAGARVDLITAFHVVEHLVDLSTFFDSIAQCIEGGSRLLAVFPNVNFQQENWSGKHDSFEHISYFNDNFVDREFRKRLPYPVAVLHGPDLVFCFAGNLTAEQQDAIDSIKETSLKFADPRILDNGNSVEQQEQLCWLQKRLQSLSLPGLVFVVNFLARNHSSSLAKRILEATRNFPQWDEQPAWFAFCYGLVCRQNGNVYGATSYLEEVVSNLAGHKDNSANGICYLANLVRNELPGLLLKTKSSEFPIISIWINDADGSADINNLLQSIGQQTYPHIQVLLMDCKDVRKKATIPEAYQRLVPEVETAGRSILDIWQDVSKKSLGEIVLLTNGQYTLSEHCLFAMYYQLVNSPDSIVVAGVRDSLAEPVNLFPGQRLIERLIGKRLNPPRDSSQAPPFVMFNRNKVSWADVDLSIVGDPARFKNYLQLQPVVVCSDVLGWLSC